MHPSELRIADFTYQLPADRIATHPLPQRDSSRLLLYRDGVISEDNYRNIAGHIPGGALMVFNQTRVVHARLLFRKPTGGIIEIFCLAPAAPHTDIQAAMQQKRIVTWECMIGGAGKWKDGMVLELQNDTPAFTLSAAMVGRNPDSYLVNLSWDRDLSFAEVLQYAGQVPLPPYLHRDAEETDETGYQTIYARDEGSVAAPTAGLHFTGAVMDSLDAAGIDRCFVTLHVGAGTFKPVKAGTMSGHEMHAEWIGVEHDIIRRILDHGDKPLVAVGTTSLRTLESLYWIGNKIANGQLVDLHGIAISQWEPYDGSPQCAAPVALQALSEYMKAHKMERLTTRTAVLIAPGYRFRVVSGLVTNFHQPQSTLLLLVAAFIGSDWKKVYDYALSNDFRFLSYGDGSLLWRG